SAHRIALPGQDHHDRIAGGNPPADSIRGRLKDDTVLWRAQIGALELILRRNLALHIFADLAVSLAQLLGNVAGHILIYWMICNCISAILPFASAAWATICPRSPSSRASSRCSEVSRLSWTRFFCHRSRTPASLLLNAADAKRRPASAPVTTFQTPSGS